MSDPRGAANNSGDNEDSDEEDSLNSSFAIPIIQGRKKTNVNGMHSKPNVMVHDTDDDADDLLVEDTGVGIGSSSNASTMKQSQASPFARQAVLNSKSHRREEKEEVRPMGRQRSFTEIGNSMHVSEGKHVLETKTEAVRGLQIAMGVHWGSLHTQVMELGFTRDGPVLEELHELAQTALGGQVLVSEQAWQQTNKHRPSKVVVNDGGRIQLRRRDSVVFSITPEKLSQRAIELTEASQQQNTGENQKETELFDGKWLLNSNDLMAGGKCLGTGTYGAVYAVKRFLNELDTQLPHGISYTSEIAAIKKLNGLDYRFRELIDIRYETIMLRNMNSQLFVPFHGMYQDVKTKTIGLVYDYMHSGNVSMAVRGWGFVSIADKSKWALQLASALQLLHHQNPPIVHGSLSLNNLLLTDDLNACLMDFGMLGLKKQMQMPATAYNTSFLAPEILMGDDFSIEADMYALGICLWELFMGKEPHENLQPMEIATAVVNDIRPTLESHIEPAIAKLCRKLWRRNPEDRGTIDEVVRDLIAFEEYVSTELVGASTSIHGAGRATPSSARSNPFLVTQGSTKSGKSGKSNLTVDVERGR